MIILLFFVGFRGKIKVLWKGEKVMNLKVRVADPAGNITIFVMDPAERKDYPKIAALLLEQKEFQAEQVGFIEKKEDGTMRMQMMGGEFCGNASRSFGYFKSMMDETHPRLVPVEVSGSARILTAEVDLQAGTSRIDMPLPLGKRMLETPEGAVYPMIVFDGICHIIVEAAPQSAAFTEMLMELAKKEVSCDAYGIMFLEGEKMTPVVYVKETDSLIWESSCGSGSMGAAVYLAGKEEDGTYVYQFQQPGGIIEAVVQKKGGKTEACKMGGAVSISEEICVEIPWKG